MLLLREGLSPPRTLSIASAAGATPPCAASGTADFPPPESILPPCLGRGPGEARPRGEEAARPHLEVANGLLLVLDVS